jgi:hypothetical protein
MQHKKDVDERRDAHHAALAKHLSFMLDTTFQGTALLIQREGRERVSRFPAAGYLI